MCSSDIIHLLDQCSSVPFRVRHSRSHFVTASCSAGCARQARVRVLRSLRRPGLDLIWPQRFQIIGRCGLQAYGRAAAARQAYLEHGSVVHQESLNTICHGVTLPMSALCIAVDGSHPEIMVDHPLAIVGLSAREYSSHVPYFYRVTSVLPHEAVGLVHSSLDFTTVNPLAKAG